MHAVNGFNRALTR